VNQLTRLREWFERLAPRERRLMGVLGVALCVFSLFLVPLGISLMLSSRRDANKALGDAIFSIKNAREEVQRRHEKREAILARYVNRAPALASVLEKAARDNQIVIQDSLERPEAPHGKKYIERVTVIRLRKTGMLQLGKMLEQIEQQLLPISISRLNIRRRGGERDSYDVELGVSAFDRNESSKEAPAPSASGGGK
jgi:general secretion pathway protein M